LSKSSASNHLVRRIYAHARPKIPSDLKSGAWKTGPNLWDRLTRQAPTQAHRSPRCWRDLFIRQAICNVQAPAEPGAPLPALSFFGGFRTTAPVLVASSEMGRHPKPVTKADANFVTAAAELASIADPKARNR
jgi:hypothetical protein